MKQKVTIRWYEMALPPDEEGTYLVAFDDGTVETYPMSEKDIQTATVTDGYSKGIYWAYTFKGPQCS